MYNDSFFNAFCIFPLLLPRFVSLLNLNCCWIWNNKNSSKIIYCERRNSGLWSPRGLTCECIAFHIIILFADYLWFTLMQLMCFLSSSFSFSALVLSAQVVWHNWQWKICTEYWRHLPKIYIFNSFSLRYQSDFNRIIIYQWVNHYSVQIVVSRRFAFFRHLQTDLHTIIHGIFLSDYYMRHDFWVLSAFSTYMKYESGKIDVFTTIYEINAICNAQM